MSDEVSDQGQGGAKGETSSEPNQEPSAIKPEDHERAIQDMHKYKKNWKDSQSEITNLKSRLGELEKSRLEEKEDFKSLYEQERENHQQTRDKEQKLKQSLLYTERYRAIYPKLVELGLRNDAVKILERENLDDLEVETTSEGRFLVHGVETFAERFKRDYPFAFEARKAPNINSGGGATGDMTDEELTPAKLFQLEKKDPEKYKVAIAKYIANRKKTA